MSIRIRQPFPRRAFSLLEMQTALVVFATALAGIVPLVVMYSRQLKRVEQRLDHHATHYLVPSTDKWACKLGAAARIQTTDPGPKPSPPVLTLDNSDSACIETGSGWVTETESGAYRGGHRRHESGDGSNKSTWQFTGLEPGWYSVRLTWIPAVDRASNAPFTVFDDTVNRGTFAVNQSQAPSGSSYDGATWTSIAVVSIASGTALVELTDAADGQVVADGVRLVPVRNAIRVNDLTRSLTSEVVGANVTVTVVTP